MLPFKVHWYAGAEPPLVIFAVKVTGIPEQMLGAAGLLVILTVGFAEEPTVMVTALLTTVADAAHPREEVIRHVTIAPSVSTELVNVLLFVPTFTPPIFH